jgi:hypothetical protein
MIIHQKVSTNTTKPVSVNHAHTFSDLSAKNVSLDFVRNQ